MSSSMSRSSEYNTNGYRQECKGLSDLLAKNARLEEPLPADTDLSEAEQKETQTQIQAILILPQLAVDDFWNAFAAHHLIKLAAALRMLSLATQKQAVSTLIQILSILPEPKIQPYFRAFLQNSTVSNGLPTLVASSFVRGLEWKRPSGPGPLCSLIINLLFWCKTRQGDDGKASIDAAVRHALLEKLKEIKNSSWFERLEKLQQVEVRRLMGVLTTIDSEEMPEDYYLRSTQEYLVGQLDRCEKFSCAEEAELTCSRCKSVRYCGKECQAWHWKKGHKIRCFQNPYL